MDDPAESGRHLPVRRDDLKRSRDASDHQGWIIQLVRMWRKHQSLARFEEDELISIAFIESDDLLKRKYNPEISTASYFLSKFLFSRVQYRALTLLEGNRKRPTGWIQSVVFSTEQIETGMHIDKGDSPVENVIWDDLVESVHPDVKSALVRIGQGQTIDEILAEDMDMPLFEYLGRHGSFSESKRELLSILKSELRRLTR